MTNTVMDRTGTLANLWLLALMYVVFILNNTASPSLNYITPSTYLSGTTNDISPMLRFRWYEPVYYKFRTIIIFLPSRVNYEEDLWELLKMWAMR